MGHSDSEDSLDDYDDDFLDNTIYECSSEEEEDEESDSEDTESDNDDDDDNMDDLPNYWNHVPGNAEKVITNNNKVLAINSRHSLFEFNNNDNTWIQVDCDPIIDIGVGNDESIFAVGRSNEVYRKLKTCSSWKKIKKAKLERIASSSKNNAWGINTKGNVYQWNGMRFSKIDCKKKMKRIAVSDSCVYGVSRKGKVMKWDSDNRQWIRILKNKVNDIDISEDGSLWCINSHGHVGNISTQELDIQSDNLPSLKKVAGIYDSISATSNNDIWAVDSNKNIYHWILSEEDEKQVSEAANTASLLEIVKLKEQITLLTNELYNIKNTNIQTTNELSSKIQELETSRQSLITELNSKNNVIKSQEQEIIQNQESLKVFEEEIKNIENNDENEEILEKVDFQEKGAENGLKTIYEVTIKTGHLKGSGTDSHVYIKLFSSESNETCEMYLDNSPDNFSTGRLDHFTVRPLEDYSSITKILLGHDNNGFGPSWFVDYVTIRNNNTQELTKFHFGKWFSSDMGDGLIARECEPFILDNNSDKTSCENNLSTNVINYKISIITGNIRGAGTDSQVFIQLFGEYGESLQTNIEGNYDRGSTVIGGIQSLDLGNLEKIRIGHNNTGWGPGWFLDKVIIRNELSGQEWYYLSGQWFSTDDGDGQIVRTIESSLENGQSYTPFKNYIVTVSTGDRRGAGTDSNVSITLYGENGEQSGERKLESNSNNFERNQIDEFGIECIDLGTLTKIRIGHDNKGWGAGWFLDKVIITDPLTNSKWFFLSGQWFSTNEGDGQIVREIPSSNEDGIAYFPLISYSVSIITGDRRGAGTDSIVSLALYGDKGDTGDRILDASHSAFERGKTDNFTIEAVDIGILSKLRVSHDNSGWGSAWFLEKIIIRNETSGEEYFFLSGDWIKSGDGKDLVKEISARNADGKACRPLVNYKVDVITGDRRGAGTSANVHIILFGENGDSGKRILEPNGLGFSRNETETFGVEAVDLGEISRIEIGHDNSGWLAGWFLDKVIITNQSTGNVQYYPCGNWLDSNEGDGQIVRELLSAEDGPTYKPLNSYTISIITGDRRGAGTNANVTAIIYGEFGDSGLMKLDSSSNDFERGNTDKFQFSCPYLGEIIKLRIGHDDSGWGSGWFLDKCILEEDGKDKKWFFLSGQWFDKNTGDGEIQRELPAVNEDGNTYLPISHYKITVITGDRRGAGTNSTVTATIYGENSDTGPIILENANNNFKRNSRDEFGYDAVELGSITRLKIGHDNSGFGAGWFLDKVIITSESLQRDYYFPFGRWLATDEEDGQIFVEKEASEEDSKASDPIITYKISVFTGDRRGAGTDANVFIELTGEDGKTSGRFTLENDQNNFERKKEDIFGIESVCLGQLSKIVIGHDNSGWGSGWFLDKIIIQNMATAELYYFICQRWLSTSEEDGQIIRELIARDVDGEASLSTKQYGICVYTGDRDGAGTNANVSLTLCGENGNSGPHILDGDPFERNTEANFQIEAVDLGNIRKIRIGHDNSGIAAGWFLEKIKIEDLSNDNDDNDNNDNNDNNNTPKIWYALCGRWISESEDDGALQRELPVGNEDGEASLPIIDYTITVITGDRRGAGTNANVTIEIFGSNGSSGVHKLENASDNFERNKRDLFSISCVDLGNINRIRIGHDNKGWGAGWFLDKVIIHSGDGSNIFFHSGRWLASDEDDGQVIREIFPSNEDKDNYPKLIDYRITVITGDRHGAGTNSKVFIQLYGENGQTPESILESELNNFERNKTETFVIQSIDIGKLTKIRIGHDNSGWGPGWFLDKIIIENEGGEGVGKYYFLCGKWLSTSEDDGKIIRELPASNEDGITCQPLISYKIEVKTGDRRGAGTNANVSLCITGENGDTGDIILDTSSNNFERNQTDIFGIQVIDLGKIVKIRIGHDNSGFFAGWFLENITITNEKTQESYFFFSGEWFDTDKGDGQIIREICATDKTGKQSLPEISYEVTVLTGDRRGAGTNANVFIEIFGENGTSGKRKLEGQNNNFERNQTDKFQIDAVDLGLIKEINIGHDNKGFGAGWFLEKVIIRNPHTGQEYYFLCGRWFASSEDDGKIVRQLTPSNEDGQASIPLVDYSISITTGDRRGAGTDACVCLKIQGSKGKSGRQILSPDDKNAFRRNKISNFGIQVPDLGNLERITIGHNDSGWGSAWFLDKVIIRNEQTGKEYFFLCGKWLASNIDDGKIIRTIPVAMEDGTPSVPMIDYKVSVITGDRLGAGTDANVSITLFGTLGDSGPVNLDSSGNDFERNQTDIFGIPIPDVGDLLKIRIGHDDSGWNSGWFLDKVIIENPISHKKWWFLCGKWFDKEEDDKQIIRDIPANNEDGQACLPLVLYTVQVTTGSLRGAGTDANVYINIIGSNGDTGNYNLAGGRSSFEKNSIDVFGVYAVDLGEISQIEIGHDGKGWFSGWYLERVKVRNEQTGIEYKFPCGRWLDEKSDDGCICAQLFPSEDSGEISSTVAWQITVNTGDVRSAGCNANIFILLFGSEEGKETEKLSLQGDSDSFSRGKTDIFMLESENIGTLSKIRIGHDGSGGWTSYYGAAWYLSTVNIKNMHTNEEFNFEYNEWIQKQNLCVELFSQ